MPKADGARASRRVYSRRSIVAFHVVDATFADLSRDCS